MSRRDDSASCMVFLAAGLLASMSFAWANAADKEYTHKTAVPAQWASTPSFDAYEPDDFDAYWAAKLKALPAPVPGWNGGDIDLGGGVKGNGVISWNGASTAARKPMLVHLPSAGAPPGVGCCPMDNRFIVASAMGIGNSYDGGTGLGAGEHTEAILAIQQMIRNVLASGKCTGDVFVMGKSRGGGMAIITAGLCAAVRDIYVSVPAMCGYTGQGGALGAWPGHPGDNKEAGYVDACNHAKRVRCKATFSLGHNDSVTWARGQITAARNIQGATTIYHQFGDHGDDGWWQRGNEWLKTCLVTSIESRLDSRDTISVKLRSLSAL